MSNTFFRLRDLFERCADLPEGERMQWIENNVPDTGQRIELELMLAADSHEGGFFKRDVVSHIGELGAHASDPSSADEFQPESLIGRRFGSFELGKLLGRGGQGAVYLAERVGDDFRQTVAVKLLRRGIHDAQEHRRFRREREILARFEHPGVARLIDGGVSAEGVPYLAMEYVDGRAIDAWCEEKQLPRDARLRLFCELCEVVSAAQRALIVHRDLKPSNVLVTDEGSIKVLDFGIARLLDEDEAHTQTGIGLLTPGYGAPEQASGGAITLATDVYALGVLLRVLLTGEAPAGNAFGDARPLPHDLAPELGWIIGKATAAETERRYRDVAELNEDTRRFLDARPVRAHPPSRAYRMRKFVQRHRGSMLVTAAMLAAILASLGLSLWQAKIAREQAQRAEATRDFVVEIFQSASEELPKDQRPTPEALIEAAATRLKLDEKLAPDMRAGFYSTLASISFSTGALEKSIDYSQRALDILGHVGSRNREQMAAAKTVHATTLNGLGKTAEADQLAFGVLSDSGAQDNKVRIDALNVLVETRQKLGQVQDSLRFADESVAIAEHLQGINGDWTINALSGRGTALYLNGRVPEALAQFEECLRRWKVSGRAQDYAFASLLHNLGVMRQQKGDYVEAAAYMQEALAIKRRIFSAPHESIARTLIALTALQADRGEYAEAKRSSDESFAMIAALFPPAHTRYISALTAQGALLLTIGNADEALPLLQRAEKLCIEGEHQKDELCVDGGRHLVRAYAENQRLVEADAASERNFGFVTALYGASHPNVAMSALYRGKILQQRQLWPESLTYLDMAKKIYSDADQGQGLTAAQVEIARAQVLLALKRHAEAYAAIVSVQPTISKLAPGHRSVLIAHSVAMQICAALGKSDEAREHASAVLKIGEPRGALKPELWEQAERLARQGL